MPKSSTTQCWLFPELAGKPIVARFDQEHSSSDGGAVLLQAAERRLGLVDRLARCLPDERDQGKIVHELEELVRQRVFALACGYADCNDTAQLAEDPIHKLLVGRDPIHGERLASQSTLSPFENGVGPKDLYRLGEALAERGVERHCRRLEDKVHRITLDLDPANDPTHGGQQALPVQRVRRHVVLPAGAGVPHLASSMCLRRCCARVWRPRSWVRWPPCAGCSSACEGPSPGLAGPSPETPLPALPDRARRGRSKPRFQRALLFATVPELG